MALLGDIKKVQFLTTCCCSWISFLVIMFFFFESWIVIILSVGFVRFKATNGWLARKSTWAKPDL